MNRKNLTKCLAMISAVIMTGCSSSEIPAETVETTLSDEVTTVSETYAETTVSEENLPLADPDISDYDKRFCGWKFDESIILDTEDEFYLKGGTADMLSAAENAVRQSDIWKNTESLCKTAVLLLCKILSRQRRNA